MKKSLFLLFLFAVLFFACSDSDLNIKEPETRSNVFCFVESQSQCYEVSVDICASLGGLGNSSLESCELSKNSSSSLVSSSSTPSSSSSGTFCKLEASCEGPWPFDLCLAAEGQSATTCDEDPDPDSFFCKINDYCVSVPNTHNEACFTVGGGIVESCSEIGDSSSSVADDGSSSSIADDGSSSSVATSSSSSVTPSSSSVYVPPPSGETYVTGGSFEFRNFDYNEYGNKIYYLRTAIYASASEPPYGTSQLWHSLSASLSCGSITIEVDGGGPGFSIPFGSGATGQRPTAVGPIIAYAVATCDGKKVMLASTEALITENDYIPSPPPMDDPHFVCSIPPYIGKDEPLGNFVSLIMDPRDNVERCGPIVFDASIPSTGTHNLSITASVECDGIPSIIQEECSRDDVIVSDYYEKYTTINESKRLDATLGETTTIEVSEVITLFGCGDTDPPYDIKFNNGDWIKNTLADMESHQIYWVKAAIPANVANDGNRFLLETNQGGLRCEAE
ncbi:MAG: hypothetical protein FWH22_00250 [Fibromonadales bacterium]|nr:hypothetical protein [Fibromonadales bacterium]